MPLHENTDECMSPSVARLLSQFSQLPGNARPPTESRALGAPALEAKIHVDSITQQEIQAQSHGEATHVVCDEESSHAQKTCSEECVDAHCAPSTVSADEHHSSAKSRTTQDADAVSEGKQHVNNEDKEDGALTKSPMRSATVQFPRPQWYFSVVFVALMCFAGPCVRSAVVRIYEFSRS
jgi:hypothetical protein